MIVRSSGVSRPGFCRTQSGMPILPTSWSAAARRMAGAGSATNPHQAASAAAVTLTLSMWGPVSSSRRQTAEQRCRTSRSSPSEDPDVTVSKRRLKSLIPLVLELPHMVCDRPLKITAAQRTADLHEQLVGRERLDHVAGGPVLKRFVRHVDIVRSGQHDDGGVEISHPRLVEECRSRFATELEIDKCNLGVVCNPGHPRLSGTRRLHHSVMGALQDTFGGVAHRRVVIDNKDCRSINTAGRWAHAAIGPSSRGNASASIKRRSLGHYRLPIPSRRCGATVLCRRPATRRAIHAARRIIAPRAAPSATGTYAGRLDDKRRAMDCEVRVRTRCPLAKTVTIA